VASEVKPRRQPGRYEPWLLLAPVFIVLTLVGIYPLFYSIWISLTGYQPTNPSFYQGFIFLDNYIEAVQDPDARHSLAVTVIFTVCSVSLSLVLGLALAFVFNQRLPGFVVLRTAILIPMLVTPIAVGITWRFMYNPELGVINYFLTLVGIPPQPLLGSMAQAVPLIILVDVWQWTPFMFLILFAGVRSLPRSPFEAALIDGATWWQTFYNITLPLLRPVILLAVLLRAVDAVRTYDQVFMMTRGGPNLATDIMSVYLQRINFRFFDIGYGASLSWLFLILLMTCVIIFIRYSGFLRHMMQREGT
jgi:multiple sugar transport system permease protein